MGNNKWTPGPWKAFIRGRTIAVGFGKNPGARPCIVDWMGFDSTDLTKSQNQANARLIAAAPELAECVQKAISLVELDVVTVSPTNRDELMDALIQWNRVLAKAGAQL